MAPTFIFIPLSGRHGATLILSSCSAACYMKLKHGSAGGNIMLQYAGLLLGMLTITRPVNIIFILIPLLWPAQNDDGQQKNSKQKMAAIGAGLLLCCATGLLQCSYWHYTTGHWLHYSYADEGFDFKHPRIGDGLFSFRIGWFVYTPLAFIMVCAIPLLWKMHARIGMLCTIILSLYVYVAFCWRPWHYAGGFSSRPMIDILPLMALPMTALATAVLKSKKVIRTTACVVFALLVVLNLFQTYQKSIDVIDNFKMSKPYYLATFGKLKVSAEDRKLMLTDDQVAEQE